VAELRSLGLWLVLLCFPGVALSADEVFARVNGKALTQDEIDSAVYMTAKQRFYHGRVDDKRAEALRREVIGQLIDRLLLLEEAERRHLKVSAGELEKRYSELRGRYRLDSMPQDHRQQLEGEVRRQAGEQLRLELLEAQVKSVDDPEAQVLEAFYRENLDKFTTPPRLRLSLILLKVVPSAPGEAWREAEREAEQLRRKLDSGADFAALARLHSGDASAESGGDLGFIHEGMLSRDAQAAVDPLKVGQVSAPVVLLQGVALFRVEERQAAKVNPFEQVRERALGLWRREEAGKAWDALLRDLRARAKIEIIGGEMTAAMIWAH
jgi:parvulin-like peptidyl-prolyl isomerase